MNIPCSGASSERRQRNALLAIAAFALLCGAAYAVTNITVTVSLPETKHTNLVQIASKQNLTIEQFLSESMLREIEGQRLSMLIELWQAATPAQQENALNALRPPPPPPPQP
jgi:hypothetical protein